MNKVAATPARPTIGRPFDTLRTRGQLLAKRPEFIAFVLLLIAGLFLALRTDTFLTSNNLFNLGRAFSWIAIAGLGGALVIIAGGIDMSVGSVMALSGFVTALGLQADLPLPLAIGGGLLTGTLVGMANGMLVARVGLPPFMVTLGTLSVARGITLSLTEGAPIRNLPPGFRVLGQHDIPLGSWLVPLPFLCMVLITLLMTLLLNYTVLGRYIYTIARSERALVAAGVPVERIKVLVYALAGLLAGVAGLLMTARLGVAAPTAATGYELDIIAAALIGGASLYGGQGSMVGVVLGAALLHVVRNGLVLQGVAPYWQVVASGTLILLVMVLDQWRLRRAAT